MLRHPGDHLAERAALWCRVHRYELVFAVVYVGLLAAAGLVLVVLH